MSDEATNKRDQEADAAAASMENLGKAMLQLGNEKGITFVLSMSGPPRADGSCDTMLSTNAQTEAVVMSLFAEGLNHAAEVSAKPMIVAPNSKMN